MKFVLSLCLLVLLASCSRTVPPEITRVDNLIRGGDLVEAEKNYDQLPEKLKKKNKRLLYQIGEAYLRRHLKSGVPNLRFHAAASFYDIKKKEYLDVFLGGLQDSFYRVQTTSAEALGELRDEGYKETLYGLLNSREEEARYLAAAVLLKFSDLKGIPVLLDILAKGTDLQNREKSADALGQYGTKEEGLVKALRVSAATDPNFFVRIEAFKALGQQGEQKDSLEGLTVLMKSDNPYVAVKALSTLAYFGDVQASRELLSYFDNKNPLLRLEALIAAGDLGFEESFPLLRDLMNGADVPSRIKAVNLLALTGDPEYLPDMIKVFAIEDRLLRINLLRGISLLAKEDEIPFIKDLLPNTDPFVEIYAARALCLIYETH